MGAQIGSVEAFATFEDSDTKVHLAGTITYPISFFSFFFEKKNSKQAFDTEVNLAGKINYTCV